jgi:hypothetical protein
VKRSVCGEIEADGESLNEAHRRHQGAQRRLRHVLDLEYNRRAFSFRALVNEPRFRSYLGPDLTRAAETLL